MNASRNGPCPCGSGVKFKRCCARKKLVFGPCEAQFPVGTSSGLPFSPDWELSGASLAPCGENGCGGLECTYCDKHYVHCHAHHGEILQMMRGHVLRVHPEKVPGIVEDLRRSPLQVATLRSQFARDPESWRKLVETVWPPG